MGGGGEEKIELLRASTEAGEKEAFSAIVNAAAIAAMRAFGDDSEADLGLRDTIGAVEGDEGELVRDWSMVKV